MAKKISETLEDDEAGLLFIREGHSMQFPGDVEVFSIFPPALDEIHRWLREQAGMGVDKLKEESKEKAAGEAERVEKNGQEKDEKEA
jgi:hypothetical protein